MLTLRVRSEGCETGRSHLTRISRFWWRFLGRTSRRRIGFLVEHHLVFGWIRDLVHRNVASGDCYISALVVGRQPLHVVRELRNIVTHC